MKDTYIVPSALIGISIILVQSSVAVALSPSQVEQIGREITVRIVNSQNSSDSGSGVIIRRSGNIYTLLTAYHVVKNTTSGSKYEIITPDKQTYAITSVKRLPDVDLAVVEFSSNQTYKIAKIGDSDKVTASTTIYVCGFPGKTAAISNPETAFFKKGQVNANGAPQRDGYNIIYDSQTIRGMSGGAVLNEQGELVAIHGRADEQSIGEQSQTQIITGLGTTIYSALRQMTKLGVDVGVKASPISTSKTPKADDFYIAGYEKYTQSNFSGAIADYTQAIRLNPNYAEAYYQRGRVRKNGLNETANAAKDLRKAGELFFAQGKSAEGYRSQGFERWILKDYPGAINAYNQAIKINPKDAQNYNSRGNARALSGDNRGAIDDFNRAIKLDANFADAYLNRGASRSELGDNRGAIADFTLALKINPQDVLIYYNLGIAYYNLGQRKAAIENLNQAIKINPQYPNAYYNRGIARSESGDKKGAVEDFTQAIKLNPSYAAAYNNRGNNRSDLGDNRGAIEDFTQAIKLNPNSALYYYNRGAARYQLQDKQGAIADFTQAIRINPQNGDFYYKRGIVKILAADRKGGIADFRQAAQLFQKQGRTAEYQQVMQVIRQWR
ncbi:tetratricopeptide repeat-containing S1 family peptidase [Calothrix sp. 336/3]|uniref:tetratricopeptide repeat-containing S1 family peptidase n=1 Tax=Calothrix sp. 336/3 TaxID=1337936 RepID=UPI0004E2DA9A|nr:tetratricopeptide repeat-containing serine protease family protein [Calothrix sp. 336/3]AKG22130.1 hypothetical protein IJ00_13445 [Calothrix sp. 336/3]